MIKCKYYTGSKANLTFQFSFWSITERRFEKKNKQDP